MLLFYLSLIETEQDKSKFEILYYEYRERMYFAAFDILNNREDAEDAVHNAFIGVAKNMKAIDEPVSDKTLSYVIKAAKNSAINIYNKNKKLKAVEYNDVLISDTDFYEQLNIKERYGDVVKAIAELDDIYKIPMYYRYVCDMKTKEIADLLGLSISAVKQRIHRGKKELLNMLGDHGDDE